MSDRMKWAGGLLLLFVLYLPFLTQAFHIDDHSFLAIADQIVRDPLHPYAFEVNLDGSAKDALRAFGNPPLQSYFLAGLIALFGHAEWIFHLFSFSFVLFLAFGLKALADRFGVDPLASVLLTLGTPAVMVMSHTCMPDVAVLALSVASVAAFIRGCDLKRIHWLVLAGLLAGAACLAKYGGVILFPIFLLYTLLHRRWIGLISIGVLAAVLAAWHLWGIQVYGMSHLTATYGFAEKTFPTSAAAWVRQLAPLFHYVGGVTIFPLAFFQAGSEKGKRWKLILWSISGVLAVVYALWVKSSLDYPFSQAALSFLMLWAAGVAMGSLLLRPLFKRPDRDQLFLILWFLGVFLSVPFQYFPAVRRILLLIPPLVLLFLRQKTRKPVVATVGLTLMLGLIISWADRSQAQVYRHFAQGAASGYQAQGGKTWFAGHWGFQHYMEAQGYEAIDTQRTQIQPGDRVIMATQPWPQLYLKGLPDFTTTVPGTYRLEDGVRVVVASSGFLPVRTLSRWGNAHFYSNNHYPGQWQFLPYTFSRAPMEVFVIYEAPQ